MLICPSSVILRKPFSSTAIRKKVKFDEARCPFRHFCVSKVITTVHVHKSGVIFHIFPRPSKQNNFKKLRPKMTKIAWRGPALKSMWPPPPPQLKLTGTLGVDYTLRYVEQLTITIINMKQTNKRFLFHKFSLISSHKLAIGYDVSALILGPSSGWISKENSNGFSNIGKRNVNGNAVHFWTWFRKRALFSTHLW